MGLKIIQADWLSSVNTSPYPHMCLYLSYQCWLSRALPICSIKRWRTARRSNWVYFRTVSWIVELYMNLLLSLLQNLGNAFYLSMVYSFKTSVGDPMYLEYSTNFVSSLVRRHWAFVVCTLLPLCSCRLHRQLVKGFSLRPHAHTPINVIMSLPTKHSV